MSVGGYRWWPTPSLTEFMLCFLASSLIPSLLLLPLRVCFHINQKFQTQGIKHKTGDWLSNYAVGILYCFTELEFEIIHVTLQASGLATKQKKKVHVFTCPHGWVSSTMSNTRHMLVKRTVLLIQTSNCVLVQEQFWVYWVYWVLLCFHNSIKELSDINV